MDVFDSWIQNEGDHMISVSCIINGPGHEMIGGGSGGRRWAAFGHLGQSGGDGVNVTEGGKREARNGEGDGFAPSSQ